MTAFFIIFLKVINTMSYKGLLTQNLRYPAYDLERQRRIKWDALYVKMSTVLT